MEPEWDRARDASDAWFQVLRPIAVDLRAETEALSLQAVARMSVVAPEVLADHDSVEMTRASTEAIFLQIAASIATGSDPARFVLPPEVQAGARTRVRRGTPLAPLIRFFWVAREVLWEWAFPRITKYAIDAEMAQAAATLLSGWMFASFDTAAALGSELYDVEREEWLRSSGAIRATTIAALLAGVERDSGRASKQMSYQLERWHVGVIAWIDEPTGAQSDEPLRKVIDEVFAASDANGFVVEQLGPTAIRAWLSSARQFSGSSFESAGLMRSGSEPVRLAMGEPALGLQGFRRTHLEATHARRVAMLLRRPASTVTQYRAVELTALSTADLELANTFVRRTLGDLAAEEDAARRLAATLAVYLEEQCSRARTASRLGIHGNTVTYRIQQAEAILGTTVDSETLRLGLALRLLPAVQGGTEI
jgi:hypothetical protein